MYASNCPVSRPIPLPNFPQDVDLNGIGFNYDLGLFYPVSSEPDRYVAPPPGSTQ